MAEITKQSVALGKKDRLIVNKVVREYGMNFSSALRFIVREWYVMKKGQSAPTPHQNGNSESDATEA